MHAEGMAASRTPIEFGYYSETRVWVRVLLPCKYCTNTWYFPEGAFRKSASSTSHQLTHVENHHERQCAGQTQPGSSMIGRMNGCLRNFTALGKQTAAISGIADELIREAIENGVLSETEAFSVIESTSFLTRLNICLTCKHENVYIPKADTLRYGIYSKERSTSRLK